MSDLKELIERELESFIEWDGDDKSIVTTTSAKLFAEHVAKIYADHVAGARKMVTAVQGEPVGEVRFELGAPSSIFAELYSKSLPALAPGTKLYTAPQPAEQQPAPDVAGLVEALESLIKGYVGLLEAGMDRITSLGGDCDPVPVMEQNDPWLRDARAALAAHRKQGSEA